MIERFLRTVFHAPSINVWLEEDDTLPKWAIALTERQRNFIGVEVGEEALVDNERVVVYDAEEPAGSTFLVGFLGNGPLTVRRSVMSRLVRHIFGAAWTLAGMVIVVLTLSGAMQILALIICVLFFLLDLMSISLRRPL